MSFSIRGKCTGLKSEGLIRKYVLFDLGIKSCTFTSLVRYITKGNTSYPIAIQESGECKSTYQITFNIEVILFCGGDITQVSYIIMKCDLLLFTIQDLESGDSIPTFQSMLIIGRG